MYINAYVICTLQRRRGIRLFKRRRRRRLELGLGPGMMKTPERARDAPRSRP